MKLPRLSLSPPDLSNFIIDIFGFLNGKIQNRYFYIFGWENVVIQYHSPHTQNTLKTGLHKMSMYRVEGVSGFIHLLFIHLSYSVKL